MSESGPGPERLFYKAKQPLGVEKRRTRNSNLRQQTLQERTRVKDHHGQDRISHAKESIASGSTTSDGYEKVERKTGSRHRMFPKSSRG
ncbi:MAG: hypothetical protein ACLP7P_04755 [Rhodomicrobium sp.]